MRFGKNEKESAENSGKIDKKSLYIRVGLLVLAIIALVAVTRVLNRDTGEEVEEEDHVISEDKLKEMSTEELLNVCLDGDYRTYLYGTGESPYEGFLKMAKEYSGLKELNGRKDAGEILLSFYKNIDLEDWKKNEKSYATRMRYLEYILGQNVILQKLTEEERSELFELCQNNLVYRKKKHKDVFHEEPVKRILQGIYEIDEASGRYEVTGGAIRVISEVSE